MDNLTKSSQQDTNEFIPSNESSSNLHHLDVSYLSHQEKQIPLSLAYSNSNQCILFIQQNVINNTTLNTNVSEFIPRTANPGLFLFPLPIPLPSLQQHQQQHQLSQQLQQQQQPQQNFVTVDPNNDQSVLALTSKLNADVPEFRPRNYEAKTFNSASTTIDTSKIDKDYVIESVKDTKPQTANIDNNDNIPIEPISIENINEQTPLAWPACDKAIITTDLQSIRNFNANTVENGKKIITTPLLSKIVANGIALPSFTHQNTTATSEFNKNTNVKADLGDRKFINSERHETNNKYYNNSNKSKMVKSSPKYANNNINHNIVNKSKRRELDARSDVGTTGATATQERMNPENRDELKRISKDNSSRSENTIVAKPDKSPGRGKIELAAQPLVPESQSIAPFDASPTYAQMLGPVVGAKNPDNIQTLPKSKKLTSATSIKGSNNRNFKRDPNGPNKKPLPSMDNKLPTVPTIMKSYKSNEPINKKPTKLTKVSEETNVTDKVVHATGAQKWQKVRTKGRRKVNMDSGNEHDWSDDMEPQENLSYEEEIYLEEVLRQLSVEHQIGLERKELKNDDTPIEPIVPTDGMQEEETEEAIEANAANARKSSKKRKSSSKKCSNKSTVNMEQLKDNELIIQCKEGSNEPDNDTESNASTISAIVDDKILVLRAIPSELDIHFKVNEAASVGVDGSGAIGGCSNSNINNIMNSNRGVPLKEFCFDINPSIFSKHTSYSSSTMKPSPFSIISATLSKSHVLLPFTTTTTATFPQAGQSIAHMADSSCNSNCSTSSISTDVSSETNSNYHHHHPQQTNDASAGLSSINKAVLHGTPLNRFDFMHHAASPVKETRLVKEEEEMVIRVMRQLSEQDRKGRHFLNVANNNWLNECKPIEIVDNAKPPNGNNIAHEDITVRKSVDEINETNNTIVASPSNIDTETMDNENMVNGNGNINAINLLHTLDVAKTIKSNGDATNEAIDDNEKHFDHTNLINDLKQLIETKESVNNDGTANGHYRTNGHHITINGKENGVNIRRDDQLSITAAVPNSCNGNDGKRGGICEQINTNHFLGVSSSSYSERDKNDDCNGTYNLSTTTNNVSNELKDLSISQDSISYSNSIVDDQLNLDQSEQEQRQLLTEHTSNSKLIQLDFNHDTDDILIDRYIINNNNKPSDNNIENVQTLKTLIKSDMIHELNTTNTDLNRDHIGKQGNTTVDDTVDNMFFYNNGNNLNNTVIDQINVSHIDNNNTIITSNSDSDEMIGFYSSSSDDEIIEMDAIHRTIQSPHTSEDSGILELQDRIESDFKTAVPRKKTILMETIVQTPVSSAPVSVKFNESKDKSLSPKPPMSTSITQAVSEWLQNEKKERTPEALFRLPNDNSSISKEIEEQICLQYVKVADKICQEYRHGNDENGGDDDEEDIYFDKIVYDVQGEQQTQSKDSIQSKNVQGNPSGAASRNVCDITAEEWVAITLNADTHETVNNTDTDDSHNDGDEDLLNFWDSDIITTDKSHSCKIPLKRNTQISDSMPTNQYNKGSESIISNANSANNIDVYDSLYGRSIDYVNLIADKDKNLSNKILNHHETDTNEKLQPINCNKLTRNIISGDNNNVEDHEMAAEISISSSATQNCNTNKSTMKTVNTKPTSNLSNNTMNNTRENYYKPPEICCSLM